MIEGYRITTLNAFGEADRVTESEFLRREFGICYRKLSPRQLTNSKFNSEHLILVTQDLEIWEESLSLIDVPLILFQIGNETYQKKQYDALNRLINVKHVFLYNPPYIPRISTSWLSFFAYILDGGLYRHETSGSVFRDFLISLARKREAQKSFINKSFTRLSQGYSNNFAANYASHFNLDNAKSLIDFCSSKKLFQTERESLLQFIGQRTNRRRENMLRNGSSLGAKVLLKDGFGGTSITRDLAYVNSLLDSVFTIIPPGHFNNYNHRYAESLICGSIPAILANNSLDPTPNSNWTNSLKFPLNMSAKYQFRYLLKTTQDERFAIWSEAFLEFEEEIVSARKTLLEFLA